MNSVDRPHPGFELASRRVTIEKNAAELKYVIGNRSLAEPAPVAHCPTCHDRLLRSEVVPPNLKSRHVAANTGAENKAKSAIWQNCLDPLTSVNLGNSPN